MSGSAHLVPCRAVTSSPARCGAASSPGTGDRGQGTGPVPSQHQGLVEAQRASERKSTDALTSLELYLPFKELILLH